MVLLHHLGGEGIEEEGRDHPERLPQESTR